MPKATIRMYRQGLGDCFLVTLTRKDGTLFYMLIDCGVILGTEDAKTKMNKVMESVRSVTERIDLLVVTHEHWDHLSGFLQAKKVFEALTFDRVWLAWTEDRKDELANKLRGEHQKMRMALAGAAARCEMAADSKGARDIGDLLEFFGAAGQGTTTAALEFVNTLAAPTYCHPTDPPIEVPGLDARFFILGPPHDETMIKRFNPSKSTPETYGLDGGNRFLMDAITAPGNTDQLGPFDPQFQIPAVVARQMKFFQDHYWGEDSSTRDLGDGHLSTNELQPALDQSWRRIDTDWLGAASDLALRLDSATNNTSLALAIELDGGEVLLFAADAQVGNWLSWQDLSWEVDGKTITGPDLLARTVLYKTGHHGSHNATMKKLGLEQMTNLRMVVIPVDHAMAVKRGWGNIPMPDLLEALDVAAKGFVLRVDQPVPDNYKSQVVATDLYYEVSV